MLLAEPRHVYPQQPPRPPYPPHPGAPYVPPPPPFVRPAPGLSPLAVALIVAGGLGLLAVGGVAAAFVVVASASADGPQARGDAASRGLTVPGVGDDRPSAATPTAVPLDPDEEESAGGRASGSAAAEGTPAPASAPPSPASPPAATKWFCNASGSARVCGFANVCNQQMVFGSGVGTDRFSAERMAKNACESSARARGSSAVCVVSCSPRTG